MNISPPSRLGALRPSLPRRAAAEFVGSGLLVTIVVGSGIAAQRLSPDDVGLQLLENSLATALGLSVLILMLGPVSGGHFNPVVSIADWLGPLSASRSCSSSTRRPPVPRTVSWFPSTSKPSPERQSCIS